NYSVLDGRVLLFAIVLAALTGFFFGVLPASLIGRLQPAADLVRSHPGHQAPANRLRSVLVAMQAAVTLVLLAGAFTLGRSFLKLTGADLGFQTDNVVTFNVALSGTPHEEAVVAYYEQALDRLRNIPGVEAAGAVEYLPLSANLVFMGGHFRPERSQTKQQATLLNATPGYFAAMRTQILEGRDFLPSDRDAAIVNESFARQFGAGLVGQRLKSDLHKRALTVVGIVRNQHFAPGSPGGAAIVVPVALWGPTNLTFVARVRGSAAAYLPVGRDALRSVDSKVPVFNASTLRSRLDDRLATPRFYTTAILFFGVFSLLLAITGIYGVSSFVVTQRTHEIGVRLAVGASPERLRAALLRQSLVPVLAGAAVGVAGAVALGRVAGHLIRTAEPVGGAACALAATVLATTAAIAICKATHRILRLDPIQVLRAD
ncbi:MAG: hypothetical protein JWP63_571, partial [Candidatus Solibacter sp.]|nr:hypothetical protein [Candidatus Solibacter sp.]